jgi:hypothetical protein
MNSLLVRCAPGGKMVEGNSKACAQCEAGTLKYLDLKAKPADCRIRPNRSHFKIGGRSSLTKRAVDKKEDTSSNPFQKRRCASFVGRLI